jgi:signal transduction histidine kinase
VAVRLALRPLALMTRLARSIARGGRGWRLSPTRPDTELGQTAAAFDDMLDALEGAEHQARVAEAASRASEERTKRFVTDAAHELRTPIAGVQAAAEAVLQQSPDASQEERDRLHLLLVRESRRASRLVNDLLDLARIDAGVDLTMAQVDLRALADAQADRIRVLAPELTVRVDGPPLAVWADEARITQIVANLLDNARHATRADGHIGVWLRQVGGFAELLVTDDGHGVPPGDRERIFDRLVRLDTARDRRFGGSGLGLPIARGFARAHGGDLSCEPPSEHIGAVFRLLLPIRVDPTASTERLRANWMSAGTEPHMSELSTPRSAVVDTSETTAHLPLVDGTLPHADRVQ